MLKDKQCSRCNHILPLCEFGNNHKSKDKLTYWCNKCRRDYQRDKAREKGIKQKRSRSVEHLRAGLKECFSCFVIKPLVDFSTAARGWGGRAAFCKPCMVLRIMKDKDAHAAKARKYRKDNPNWLIAHRGHQRRRTAAKKNLNTGLVTIGFVKDLYNQSHCHYCKLETQLELRTMDHVVPILKGGLHDPTNLVMACSSCNSSKGAMSAEEFMEKLRCRSQQK